MDSPHLKYPRQEEASNLITEQIERGLQITSIYLDYRDANKRYRAWLNETYDVLLELFATNKSEEEFKKFADG